MKKKIIFILLSLCVCVGLFAQAQFDFKSELKKAKAGDAVAQCNVGDAYFFGDGVKKDYSEAFVWYMRASEQGIAYAQFCVGECYYAGRGISQNYSEAVKWYRKAAEAGHTEAQYSLASCYDNGKGIEKDVSEAISWYRLAAEKGDIDAQTGLGFHYFEGSGVEKNYSEAQKWLSTPAEKGDDWAQYFLGVIYGENGDKDNATKWLMKSSTQGNSSARSALQYLQKNGTLKQDTAIASNTQTALQNGATTSQTSSGNTVVAQTVTSGMSGSQQPETKVETIKSDVDVNIPKTSSTNDKTFAVVIANEKYSREVDVPYALNDGGRFAEYCTSALGVPSSNVHLVENATLNDLRHEVGWITKVMNAYNGEAKVIFYYAGHGIPDESSKSALLLPVDGYGSDVSSGYPLSDLYAALNEAPSQSVTVFLDACFSGAKREGDMMASARGVAIKVNATTPKGNMVVFSAAQGDETAYPYTEKGHGLFTYYLLKKLQDTGGNVTLGDLSDYVTEQVSRQSIVINSKSQTPTVIPSATMSEQWRNEKVK